MIEHREEIEQQREHEHRKHCGAKQEYQDALVEHRQYDLDRVKPNGGCDVDVPIGVVDLMQRPQQRDFMGNHMLGVDRQIQYYERENELQPTGQSDPVEQTKIILLCKTGRRYRGNRTR